MSDTQVIVVSLAVGFGVGIAVLMVIWACKACLGKSKTADDDDAATDAARVRQQRAATAEAAVAAQQVNVQLPAGPERAVHASLVCSIVTISCHVFHVYLWEPSHMTCLMLTRERLTALFARWFYE